jgi:hypothetical protein
MDGRIEDCNFMGIDHLYDPNYQWQIEHYIDALKSYGVRANGTVDPNVRIILAAAWIGAFVYAMLHNPSKDAYISKEQRSKLKKQLLEKDEESEYAFENSYLNEE